MRVLLVGAGDLGRRVAALHRQRGDEVWVARRRPGAGELALDLAAAVDPAVLPAAIDLVEVIVAPESRTPAAYRELFVDGIGRLGAALACRGPRPPRALFVSSTAVYGPSEDDWIDEDSITAEPAWNGAILREAEAAAAALANRVTAIRAGGIYGPGRNFLIDKVRRQQGSASSRWTHRIHIDDLARVLPYVADRPELGTAINAIDTCPAREYEVLDFMAAQLGVPPLPRAADTETPDRRIGSRRLQQAGFRFQYPDFRSGYTPQLKNSCQ